MKLDLRLKLLGGMVLGALALLLLGGSLALSSLRTLAGRDYPLAHQMIERSLQARYHAVQIQQFLTDVSATGDQAGFAEADEHYRQLRQNLQQLQQLDPSSAAQLEAIQVAAETMRATGVAMARAYIESGRAAGNARMRQSRTGFDERVQQLDGMLDALEGRNRQRYGAISGIVQRAIDNGLVELWLFSLMLLAGVSLALWRMHRVLFAALGGDPAVAAAAAQRIAAGDIDNVEVQLVPGDRQSLMASIAAMIAALKRYSSAQQQMADEHLRGMIDYRADSDRLHGVYRDMMQAANRLIGEHVGLTQQIVDLIRRYAAGDFSARMAALPGEKARISEAVELIRSNLAGAAAQAEENVRIRRALDNVSSNVRITDPNGIVVYANLALLNKLRSLEGQIRQRIPDFSSERFIGMDICRFYDNPEEVRQILRTLEATRVSRMDIGGRTWDVITNPVIDANGVRLGSIGEWADVTEQLRVEAEIATLVQSAVAGDFSLRLALQGKQGFFLQLALGLNQLLETSASGLEDLRRMLAALANGELDQRITRDYQGVFADLKEAANSSADQLRAIVQRIAAAAGTINSAAREIAAGNQNLSARTEQQASSLQEAASSMEEFAGTVKQNADNARQANRLAIGASDVALKGGLVVQQVIATMEDIKQASTRIVDIIAVIDGIAFQTNILALNASVEAARAGEQGKGFAVVASEVRSLAQRAASAAKEIKHLIGDSVNRVDSGARLVDEAGHTMQEIVAAIQRVAALMQDISSVAAEQSSGIQQVTQSVAELDEMTQQNAALVEQAAAAAESMEEQARELATAIALFRLSQPPPVAAGTGAHRLPSTHSAGVATKHFTAAPGDDEWEEF